MSKLVSVSGAAGTGKSTLLEGLRYRVDKFRVARAILRKMKMDLYDILKDPVKTMEFQDLILDWKITNDESLKDDHEVEWTFVERCPADFYAFAKTWQPLFNSREYDEWLIEYHSECFAAMKHYDVAILLPPGKFSHVDDGVRAKADTQEVTHRELNTFLARRWMDANFARPCFHVHRMISSLPEDRILEVDLALAEANAYFRTLKELLLSSEPLSVNSVI